MIANFCAALAAAAASVFIIVAAICKWRPLSRAHRWSTFVAVAMLAETSVHGQAPTDRPPQPSEVRTLLESRAPKDQAWGAWWVAANALDQFEPLLRANLEAALDPARAPNGYYNQFVLDGTLDALIRVGHNALPTDILAAVYKQRPEAAVILAAESSLPNAAVDPFLRIVLDDDRASWLHTAWLGAADLLIIHHAPGTVVAILHDVTFTVHAVLCPVSVAAAPFETTVAALGNRDCGRVGAGYGGSWPSSIPDPAYPPWMHYDLVVPSRTEAAKTARGPEAALAGTLRGALIAPEAKTFIEGRADASSLAYIRYAGIGSPPTHGPVTMADRLAIVASAAPNVTLPSIDGAALVVPWHDDVSTQAAIEAFRQTLQVRYGEMITILRAAGVLTMDEATAVAVPVIQLVTDDRRK